MGTTVSTELVHHGERRDRLGRLHVPTERRRELLRMFRESGLTREAFARQEGICYTTLCTWVKRDEGARASGAGPASETPKRSATAMHFAEVAWPASVAHGLEVRLADGTIVRGERVEELVALVQALRG